MMKQPFLIGYKILIETNDSLDFEEKKKTYI